MFLAQNSATHIAARVLEIPVLARLLEIPVLARLSWHASLQELAWTTPFIATAEIWPGPACVPVPVLVSFEGPVP